VLDKKASRYSEDGNGFSVATMVKP
jgi:hypothetical protein